MPPNLYWIGVSAAEIDAASAEKYYMNMNNPMDITAIVMAASMTADPDLSRLSPNGSKSMISVNGRSAVSYVVENLRSCDCVSHVIVVGDKANRINMPDSDTFIESTGNDAEDVMSAVRIACDSSRCLIMTGDMPLANKDAITDFVTYAPDSDVVYPIVEKADLNEYFPEREAFYVGTKEGRFTGSSSLLFRPSVALERESMIANLLNARKNPTALLGMLGPKMAMKLMFAKPAISDFENHLSRALEIQCRVFISHYPELVISIDSTEDISLMEQELSR